MVREVPIARWPADAEEARARLDRAGSSVDRGVRRPRGVVCSAYVEASRLPPCERAAGRTVAAGYSCSRIAIAASLTREAGGQASLPTHRRFSGEMRIARMVGPDTCSAVVAVGLPSPLVTSQI